MQVRQNSGIFTRHPFQKWPHKKFAARSSYRTRGWLCNSRDDQPLHPHISSQPTAHLHQSLADFSSEMFASIPLSFIILTCIDSSSFAASSRGVATTPKTGTNGLLFGTLNTIPSPLSASSKASDQPPFSSVAGTEEGVTERRTNSTRKNSGDIITGSDAGSVKYTTSIFEESGLGNFFGMFMYMLWCLAGNLHSAQYPSTWYVPL